MESKINSVKRIANDVKYILNNPLHNIYYIHDDTKLYEGYALIIGNYNTPYYLGNYFFKFNFPENYPYYPPKINFLSTDGDIRFNPNLYSNGKVCLSVLNTWYGEGWTSCQTISSILLILQTLFNENPLLNEPGINKNDKNINLYNKYISFKNIDYSIIKQYNLINKLLLNESIVNLNEDYKKALLIFNKIVCDNFNKNYNIIKNEIIKFKNDNINDNKLLYISIYDIKFNYNILDLENNFNIIIIKN